MYKLQKNNIFILLILLFIVCDAKAQDTTKALKKNSIALIPDANITYPLFSNFTDHDGDIFIPYANIAPGISLAYTHVIFSNKYTILSYKIGVGTDIYNYSMWYLPTGGNFGIPTMEKIINISLSPGIIILQKFKKMGWQNELNLTGSYQVYHSSSFTGLQNSAQIVDYGNMDNDGLYLIYSTGLRFSLGKKYDLTPLISFPFLDLTNIGHWFFSHNSYAASSIPPSTSSITPMLPYNDFGFKLVFSYDF